MDEKNNMNLSLEDDDMDNSALNDQSEAANKSQDKQAPIDSDSQDEAAVTQEEDNQQEHSALSYGVNTYSSNQQYAAVAVKKKSPVMPCIIISASILVLAVVLGIVYLLFFNTSIAGTYIIENTVSNDADEEITQTYYIFDDDGNLKMLFGSLEFDGTYEIANEDGTSQITLNVQAANLYGTYNYSVSGNKLTGISIEISDTSGNSMKFISADYENPDIAPIEDAKVDSALVGTWEDTGGYGVQYTFNDDSTLVMTGSGMIINSYYSADNGQLNIKYLADSLVENDAEYSVDGETLTLNGMEFQKSVE